MPRLARYVCLTRATATSSPACRSPSAAVRRQQLRRLSRAARPRPAPHRGDREVRARDLFLQRRRRGRLSRRGPDPRAFAAGGDLRSAARDERARGDRPGSSPRSPAANTTRSSATTRTATWWATPANFDAAIRAVEALDTCIGRVVAAARAAGGEVLITADHGNAEQMYDAATRPAAHRPHAESGPLRLRGARGDDREGGLVAGHRAHAARDDGPPAAGRDDRPLASRFSVGRRCVRASIAQRRNLSADPLPHAWRWNAAAVRSGDAGPNPSRRKSPPVCPMPTPGIGIAARH